MGYSVTEGVQGVCPTGSHIPTDNEWKILEMYLGLSQAQADATNFRGTNQGTQMKNGGSSGLNIPLAGFRTNVGTFNHMSITSNAWSSSESGINAWPRNLNASYTSSYRLLSDKTNGFSIRCLED